MSDIISQMGDLTASLLSKCPAKIRKSFKSFFMETLILYVVMNKVNFTQLGRFGNHTEKTYRQHFEKNHVDMFKLNFELAQRYFGDSVGVKAIAIDPSYIPKAGKHTPFTGYFWSGAAACAKWGLEILGMGIIDSLRHECIMLGAYQTPNADALSSKDICKDGDPARHIVGKEAVTDLERIEKYVKNLQLPRPYHKKADAEVVEATNKKELANKFTQVDWYLLALSTLPKEVREYTNLVVADAFFSKYNFIYGLNKLGLKLVSRLRDDAALWYINREPHTGKAGRPKKYLGKVDIDSLDSKVFHEMDYDLDNGKCFVGQVYSKALKTEIKIVVWFSEDGKKHKIFFSNDLSLSGVDIVRVYRTRFQIEFEFRNAKGYASLNRCQARSTNKLRTHFNMSFTSMNCLKMATREMGLDYSVSNLKTMAHGQYLMKRFICVSGIEPDSNLISKLQNEVISLTSLVQRDAA